MLNALKQQEDIDALNITLHWPFTARKSTMSQDNALSNIETDLRHMEHSSRRPSEKEWSYMHRRIIQLPRTERRQLNGFREYVPLEIVLDWQKTCPLDKRITDAGTNSEEDIRIAFEINKRAAICKWRPQTIECDAVLSHFSTSMLWDVSGPVINSERFIIRRGFRSTANYIYSTSTFRTDGGTFVEFLTLATQSGCRSLVIDLNMIHTIVTPQRRGRYYSAIQLSILPHVRKWLERNYNLVDEIIFCTDMDILYDPLTDLMPTLFPVYVVNIPESNLPAEILRKGSRAIQIYKEALSDGKHAVQNIRVMLVGQSGVGKTTLLKRLLGKEVDIKDIESTDGIDVHVHRCKIDVDSGQWHCQDRVPSNPNEALHAAILTLLTRTSEESFLQTVQDTSSKSDTSPIHDDEVKYRRLQTVTDVDVTIASEPESEKSDALASTVRPQSSSSKSDDTKVEQQFEELLETYGSSKRLSVSNFANVSFWDFAGQYIFYNTHQVFLSHRTIYLLVTKLKHIVDEAGSDTTPHDTIKFWVDSIHFFCGKENYDPRVPPVILVATHCDNVNQSQKEILIQNHFQKVRNIFANKITAGHIVDDLEFAVDNSVKDPELEELKNAILEVAKTQYYWQEEHPVRWLTLEKELFVKGNSGEKVLQLEAVKDINRMLPFPLEETELDLFLQFQSDLGNILYISEGEMKDYVLLNPKWVADAFKCIITAERFFKRKTMLKGDWDHAKKTGKIKTEIIEEIWSDKKTEGFFKEREFLLLLMQQLHLIARPVGIEQPPSHYFVPCLITKRPRHLPISFEDKATSSVMTLSAASRFFPLILFHKLIASCIQKYTIHKDHIYDGLALFEDGVHVFTVLYVDNTVKVWVKNLAKAIPDSKVCQSILKFLVECLHQLLQLSCSKTPSVAIFICCPKVDLYSVQGLHELPNDTVLWQAHSKKNVLCSNESCESHSISMGDALRHWIQGPTNAEDQTYKKALAKAWSKLVDDMNSGELLDKFMEKELLSPVAIRDLRDEKITSERNRAVLEKIRILGPEKYEVFKECLTLIKQEHLAKLLNDYEREIAAQDEADAIVTPDIGTCSNPEVMVHCDVDLDNVTTNKPIVSKKSKRKKCMIF